MNPEPASDDSGEWIKDLIPQEVLLDAETFDWLMKRLDEPPRELPELRRLFAEPEPWDDET